MGAWKVYFPFRLADNTVVATTITQTGFDGLQGQQISQLKAELGSPE